MVYLGDNHLVKRLQLLSFLIFGCFSMSVYTKNGGKKGYVLLINDTNDSNNNNDNNDNDY